MAECALCRWRELFHDQTETSIQVMQFLSQSYGVLDNAQIAQHLHLLMKDRPNMPTLEASTALAHLDGLHQLHKGTSLV